MADSGKSEQAKSAQMKQPWKLLPDVWALLKPRRTILAGGFALMVVNRVSGLVLPASTKYLLDNVILKRQVHLLVPIVLAVLAATLIQGITSYSLTQLMSKSAQRMITELAPEGAGAHRTLAGRFLRHEQDGRSRFANHERRRRRAEPAWDGPGRIRRRRHDGGLRFDLSLSSQRGDDARRFRRADYFRSEPEPRIQIHPPDLSRAAKNQCGGHRAPHGIAGRRPRGEGLSRRGARRKGILRGSSASPGKRAEDAHGDLSDGLVRDRARGNHQRRDYAARSASNPFGKNDARQLLRLHDVFWECWSRP